MRPSNLCRDQLRSIVCQKQQPLRIENREMLRDAVTDYIIRSVSGRSHSLSRQHKQPRYQPLAVRV
jgi:hypothetical protein